MVVRAAEREVRDAAVLRCCQGPYWRDRNDFLGEAERAFGKDFDRDLRAALLLSHSRLMKDKLDSTPIRD